MTSRKLLSALMAVVLSLLGCFWSILPVMADDTDAMQQNTAQHQVQQQIEQQTTDDTMPGSTIYIKDPDGNDVLLPLGPLKDMGNLENQCKEILTRDGGSTTNDNAKAIETLRQWCRAQATCLQMEFKFPVYNFVGIDWMRPGGGVQQPFRNRNQLQFIQGGLAAWDAGEALFASAAKANKTGGSVFAPMTCVPPCVCQLNPAPAPPGGWSPVVGPQQVTIDYTANIGGNVVNLRAIANYSFKHRLRNGTCHPF